MKKTTVFTYGRPGDLYSHVKRGWLDDMDLAAEARRIAVAGRGLTVMKAEMFRGDTRMSSRDLL